MQDIKTRNPFEKNSWRGYTQGENYLLEGNKNIAKFHWYSNALHQTSSKQ